MLENKTQKLLTLKTAKLYFVSSSELSNYPTIDLIETCLQSGIKLIQLREKTLNKSDFVKLAIKVKELTCKYNALLIINDYVEIAKLIGADGVHLGQEDMDIKTARQILGEDFIIGKSTHNMNELNQAENEGVDYVNIGPVFATQTKPGVCSLNSDLLDEMTKSVKVPFTFMGGIKDSNIDELKKYKFSALAMITEISKTPDVKVKISKLFDLIK